MSRIIKRGLRQLGAFLADQYVVVFFMVATGYKFYIFNTYFTGVTWNKTQYYYGIVCGFATAALIFLPLLFVKKHKTRWTLVLAFLISIILLIDAVYHSYYMALPSVGLINLIGQTTDVGPAIWSLLRFKQLILFADIVIFIALLKPIRTAISKMRCKYKLGESNLRASFAVSLLIILGFILSLQQVGLSRLSEVFERGYDTVSTSQLYGVMLAHGIDIARYINSEGSRLSSSEQKALIEWAKTNNKVPTKNELTGVARGKNVIMIQVESLGAFAINQTVNNKAVTPVLDKLSQETYFYPNDRFVFGAGHTSDTDFVSNTSYFPLQEAAIFVRYGRDNFTSLPKTLIDKGYSAYAYHGFNRNFWNRNTAYQSLGYQKFYAADNYPKGVKFNMGLNDGDFLDKTADYIKAQPKPSLSYVVTLSSHVPFAIYDQTKEMGVNPSDYPDQVGGYIENIHYTDKMLGKFFEKLKKAGLYDDSLIMVYGDHTPVLPAFEAGTIKYDPGTIQVKEVPLFVKLPKQMVGKTITNTGTHLDIMPTVLDLVGIKTNQLMFGRSLFADDRYICNDQYVTLSKTDDCEAYIGKAKEISSKIVRYNQFNAISNLDPR